MRSVLQHLALREEVKRYKIGKTTKKKIKNQKFVKNSQKHSKDKKKESFSSKARLSYIQRKGGEMCVTDGWKGDIPPPNIANVL